MYQPLQQSHTPPPLEPVALKMAMLVFPLLLQKPSKKSKTKDHVRCLKERLLLWQAGNLEDLLRKGRVIQKKLLSSLQTESNNNDKMFCRLMLHGKVSAALRWIGDRKTSVHKCTTEIIEKLKSLHPTSKKPSIVPCINRNIERNRNSSANNLYLSPWSMFFNSDFTQTYQRQFARSILRDLTVWCHTFSHVSILLSLGRFLHFKNANFFQHKPLLSSKCPKWKHKVLLTC